MRRSVAVTRSGRETCGNQHGTYAHTDAGLTNTDGTCARICDGALSAKELNLYACVYFTGIVPGSVFRRALYKLSISKNKRCFISVMLVIFYELPLFRDLLEQ